MCVSYATGFRARLPPYVHSPHVHSSHAEPLLWRATTSPLLAKKYTRYQSGQNVPLQTQIKGIPLTLSTTHMVITKSNAHRTCITETFRTPFVKGIQCSDVAMSRRAQGQIVAPFFQESCSYTSGNQHDVLDLKRDQIKLQHSAVSCRLVHMQYGTVARTQKFRSTWWGPDSGPDS